MSRRKVKEEEEGVKDEWNCLFCNQQLDKDMVGVGMSSKEGVLDRALATILCDALYIPLIPLSSKLINSPLCSDCGKKVQNIKQVVISLAHLRNVLGDFQSVILKSLEDATCQAPKHHLDQLRKEVIKAVKDEVKHGEGQVSLTMLERMKVNIHPSQSLRRRLPGRRKKKTKSSHQSKSVNKEDTEEQLDQDEHIEKEDDDGSGDGKEEDDRSYLCALCSSSFKNTFDLEVHTKRAHLGVKQPYACSFEGCKRSFRQRYLYLRHQEYHQTGVNLLKRFTCDICGNSYETNNSLQRHKSSHTGDWKYKCTGCTKGFHRPSALKAHQAKEHDAECPYSCPKCECKFSSNRLRQVHLSSLHPETLEESESTVCGMCDKVFSGKDALRCHKIQVHGASGSTSHSCSHCGKIFAKKSWLDRHGLQHTTEKKFKCEECGEAFRFPNSLATHKLKHGNKKPFHCSVCQKGFRLKTQCGVHELTHQRNKEWICEFCGKAFNLGVYLRHHRKRVHYQELGMDGPPKYFIKGGSSGRERKKKKRVVEEGVSREEEEEQTVYEEAQGVEREVLEEVVVGDHPMQLLQLGTVTLDSKGGNEPPQYIQVFVQQSNP